MSGSMSKKAAVVGAGISGLYASLLLEQRGYEVDLFDKSSSIGGRLNSIEKSGFILDRGFHVMQTGYPLASSVFDYDQLGCRAFEPGALVIRPGSKSKIWRFSDPFRRPLKGFMGIFNLFTSPINLLRVGLLRWKVSRTKDEDLFLQKSQSTFNFLRSRGFTENFIHTFFRPLFGGIFLESNLRTDSRMFNFVFKNMSRGNMVLPKHGISSCAEQLYQKLTRTKLKLQTEVTIKSDKELTFGDQSHSYDVIIQAFSPQDQNISRDVWTIYFAAPKTPLNGKYIMLNSTVSKPENIISHLAVPSDIQPNYAPRGQSLVAVTVVGEDARKQSLLDKKSIEKSVLSELSNWFPEQISSWKTLDVQYIKSALPELDSTHYDNLKNRNQPHSCGDHTFHGSVEGALLSARYAVDESTKTTL